ncbi:coagulation factor V-like isoform X4 [Homarus americanus]|uniref:coagulation factor V-like isoform X4 n=1 Tax=Homarus americanus TaxID=6706 RepID=UPI001C46A3AC|nr:coagulation factor V-like isoform X4 [Homarus americanus]
MNAVIHVITLCIITTVTITEAGNGVFTTSKDNVYNVTVPKNSSESSFYLWANHPNTSVKIQFVSVYPYSDSFTITQVNVWHLSYVYQPTKEKPLQIQIPLDQVYVQMDYFPVEEIVFSSDALVYWSFCSQRHTCIRLPLPPPVPKGIHPKINSNSNQDFPDNCGTQVSPDNCSSQISPDNRGTQVSPDNCSSQVSPDNRGTQVSPDNCSSQISPDNRGTQVSPDNCSSQVSPDNRGTQVSFEYRGIQVSPDYCSTQDSLDNRDNDTTSEHYYRVDQ